MPPLADRKKKKKKKKNNPDFRLQTDSKKRISVFRRIRKNGFPSSDGRVSPMRIYMQEEEGSLVCFLVA